MLLASGTGFAPIKALLEHMKFKGIERPATLYWGGRRPEDLYMDDWVRDAAGRDAEPALRAGGLERRARGRLDAAAPASSTGRCWKTSPTSRATRSMPAARPSWSIRPSTTTWRERGLPEEEFFADAFTTEADKALP